MEVYAIRGGNLRALACYSLFQLSGHGGMDGVFLALLQERRRVVVPNLVRIFHACLATGYIPAIWSQVKEVFILKPSKNSYSGPRDFRPISLTSILLKTMVRLVDGFLREEILASVPLHPNQHAYQTGKFVETALSSSFSWRRNLTNSRQLGMFFS